MKKLNGLFITFEGAEGSGKSTQVKLLADYLKAKNIDVEISREPGGTNIGEQIREILLNPKNIEMHSITELLLYSASRAQHIFEKIIPAINAGKIFISDRFAFASLAYQGYGRQIDLDIIYKITEIATNKIMPDLIFLLDAPVEIGLEKAKKKSQNIYNNSTGDRLENEDLDFHQRVRNGYLTLAKTNKNVRLITYDSIENVHNQIKKIMQTEFNL